MSHHQEVTGVYFGFLLSEKQPSCWNIKYRRYRL